MKSGTMTENMTYLTFTLDQEDFAVEVSGVREVLDYTDVTRVPRTPDFMKGVINLRGSVVPVIDMRLKFGLAEAEKTVDTCVIVLEVELEGETTVIGAIADSVKEVFELDPSQIEPPPRLGTRFDTEFISGMGKHGESFIIILDVNKVFSSSELDFFRRSDEDDQKPVADYTRDAPHVTDPPGEEPGDDPDSGNDNLEKEGKGPEMPVGEPEPAKKTARRKMDPARKTSDVPVKDAQKRRKKARTPPEGKK